MTERTPVDGRPFYCEQCGLGFAEYLACEGVACELETAARADSRRLVFLMTLSSTHSKGE